MARSRGPQLAIGCGPEGWVSSLGSYYKCTAQPMRCQLDVPAHIGTYRRVGQMPKIARTAGDGLSIPAVRLRQLVSSSSSKSVICNPAGASILEFKERQGVSVGGAMSFAPASTSRSVATLASATSKPTRILRLTSRPTSRSSINRFLGRIDDLKCRPTRVECHHTGTTLTFNEELLAQAKCVSVEADSGFEVICFYHETHLRNHGSRCLIFHLKAPIQLSGQP